MAVDVGKSPPEASVSRKGDGSWGCTEVEMDNPELAGSLHQLLRTEVAKPCPQRTESTAMSRGSRLATGAIQGGLSYHPEVSSASPSPFPRARASLSEPERLVSRASEGGDVPRRLSQRFLSSAEQQVKASGCWEPVSSPPSQPSSAEENILAGSSHDAHTSQRSHSLGAQSPSPSTPELLQPLSPRSTPQSHSASCFSSLASVENSLSEEPSQSLLASVDVPSSVATTTQDLCCRWAVTEGRTLRACKPFSALLGDHMTREHLQEMPSYQADYWACAIPDSFPPSPDRGSPHWNPHKEYEDLLDYAYPLKPRYRGGKMPEPFFHDSGIGLDSFSVSPEGTLRSTSICGRSGQAWGGRENGYQRFVASAERFSTPRKRGCSGAGSCYEPLAMAKELSFTKSDSFPPPPRGLAQDVRMESAALGSPGLSAARGRSWCARGSPFPNSRGQGKGPKRFLPTTRVLPLRKEWEGDEEFLSLPPRLLELEGLAQFLSSLSLTVRTPGHDHGNPPGGSKGRQPLPSTTLASFGEAGGRGKRGNTEDSAGLWHPCSSQKPSWENTESCGQIHRDPLLGPHLPAGVRDRWDGTCLAEPGLRGHLRKSQQSQSLAQCIQMFSCQLEELIGWLYKVVAITDSWGPASRGTEAARASLHRCWELRREVAGHRGLAESVLERGAALLDCMAATSPALKDTLALIAKQSEELETHAEHLCESVLTAVGKEGLEEKEVQQALSPGVLPLSELALVTQSQDG